MLKLLLMLPLLGMSNTCDKESQPISTKMSDNKQAAQHKASSWKVNDEGTARIQSDLQQEFFAKIMKSKDYQEGYALFSYGGWSNEGQTMILCQADGSGNIVHIAPNSTKELPTHNFSQANLTQLRASLPTGNLYDFTPKVFDGIEYEYVHAVKQDDSNLNVKTRIYMKVPSLAQAKPNHYLQIVNAFNIFKQEFYAK